jgi:hypothetical protein
VILILEIALGVALGLVIYHQWQSVLGLLVACLVVGIFAVGGYWIWAQDWSRVNWGSWRDWVIGGGVVASLYLLRKWIETPRRTTAQKRSPGAFSSACRRIGQLFSFAERKRKPTSTS